MLFKEYVPLAIRTEAPVDNFLRGILGRIQYPTTMLGEYQKVLEPVEDASNVLEGHGIEPMIAHIRGLHAAMGLCTEAGELLTSTGRQNTFEELGDLCWYLAVLADATGLMPMGFCTAIPSGKEVTELSVATAELLDMYKKRLFYGKLMDGNKVQALLDCISIKISAICCHYSFELREVLERNIDKLAQRYGDKFTDYAAINRDLEAEKKALEN